MPETSTDQPNVTVRRLSELEPHKGLMATGSEDITPFSKKTAEALENLKGFLGSHGHEVNVKLVEQDGQARIHEITIGDEYRRGVSERLLASKAKLKTPQVARMGEAAIMSLFKPRQSPAASR